MIPCLKPLEVLPLSAAATTVPALALELIGLAGVKGVARQRGRQQAKKRGKEAEKLSREAARTFSSEQLKDVSRGVFKEIDELGVTVKPEAMNRLVNKLDAILTARGVDQIVTPKSFQALRRLQEVQGQTLTTTQLDTLRKIAQNAAKSIEPADKAMGAIIIDEIDSFLDTAGPKALNFPEGSPVSLSRKLPDGPQVLGTGPKD